VRLQVVRTVLGNVVSRQKIAARALLRAVPLTTAIVGVVIKIKSVEAVQVEIFAKISLVNCSLTLSQPMAQVAERRQKIVLRARTVVSMENAAPKRLVSV
jgi:hypothetical protein